MNKEVRLYTTFGQRISHVQFGRCLFLKTSNVSLICVKEKQPAKASFFFRIIFHFGYDRWNCGNGMFEIGHNILTNKMFRGIK